MKSPGGGKALLFEKPIVDGKASKFPVAINTMGSRRRMALALQRRKRGRSRAGNSTHSQSETADRSARRLEPAQAGNSPAACAAEACEGRRVPGSGASLRRPATFNVQLEDFSLRDLPILKCWPKDGGRFITLPNVHTRDPETGARNVGMYRMQIYDDRTTAMHWQVHKVGARHGKRYYERSERMPVAVTLGGDPAYTFAATAPLPDGLDEILFAGFIAQEISRARAVQDDRSGSAGRCRFRPRRLRPAGRNAAGRTVRRSHRFLHRGRGLSRLSSHRDHASARRDLSDHDRRHPADGRFLSSATPASGFSCRFSK